jgi:hypothetical protein
MKDMGSQYERLFGALPAIQPSARLCERVTEAIREERARSARARFGLSSLSLVLSVVGFYYAGRALLAAAYQSGFSDYASLAFSDGGIVIAHLPSFGLPFIGALLESLPGPETAFTLALIAIAIESLRTLAIAAADWRLARPAAA